MGSEVVPYQQGEKGMTALLAATLPHGRMEDKNEDEKMEVACPRRPSCSPSDRPVWVSPPRGLLAARIFRCRVAACDSAAASDTRR